MNLKLFIFFIFLLILNITVKSQVGIICGKIVNEDTNEPIPFVKVSIESNNFSNVVTTDFNGIYLGEIKTPGVFNINTSYPGYHNFKILNITCRKAEAIIINFKLATTCTLSLGVEVAGNIDYLIKRKKPIEIDNEIQIQFTDTILNILINREPNIKYNLINYNKQDRFLISTNFVEEKNNKANIKTSFITNCPIIAHEIVDTSKIRHTKAKIIILNDSSFHLNIKAIEILNEIDTFISKTIKIIDIPLTNAINIFYNPNPTTGKVNINIEGKIDELFLTDSIGQLLKKFNINGKKKQKINLSKYSNGLYFLKFKNNENLYVGKIIKISK